MARAQSTDFLQNFRYAVTASDPTLLQPEGGFNSVTIPDISIEIAEYREGTDPGFPKKFPGLASFTDITLTRGVVRGDTKFFDWVNARVIGGQEYRTDIAIFHFHRDDQVTQAKTYQLKEAFPIRVKVAGDLDAASSDVSISELDIAFESMELTSQ